MITRTGPPVGAQSYEEKYRTTVFYDGSCPLCQAEIGYYENRDSNKRLHLVDVSAPDLNLPAQLDRNSAMARFHVLSRDGQLLSGAAAFVEVWKQVPGWGLAAKIAALPGVLTGLELAYRAFLLIRPATVRLFMAMRRPGGKPNAEH